MINTTFGLEKDSDLRRTDLRRINRGFQCAQEMFKLLNCMVDTQMLTTAGSALCL
jgi:hypothetical protein